MPDPPNCASLSDRCTTADCIRLAVRVVEVEDCGEHPYCEPCAALMELDPNRPFETDAEYVAALNRELLVERSQREDAESEVARLRAVLEIFADRENWTGHGLAAMEAGPLICGHFDPIELAREALNGGER